MELSVVIPAHNEQENLPALVEEVTRALESVVEYEIVAVDDCSDDRTNQSLQLVSRTHPRLRVVRHVRRSGQSAAVVSGVRAARGAWIATIDGDGQNDPADIAMIWRDHVRQNGGSTVFAGWRTRRRDSALKIVSSRVANKVRAALLGDATPDTGCGLKVFPREAFLRLPAFNHMHRFLPALFQRLGYQVVSVPVSHRPRLKGSSHYGVGNRLWVGMVDILGVMWLKARPVDAEVER